MHWFASKSSHKSRSRSSRFEALNCHMGSINQMGVTVTKMGLLKLKKKSVPGQHPIQLEFILVSVA